jgi:hypothetical protein
MTDAAASGRAGNSIAGGEIVANLLGGALARVDGDRSGDVKGMPAMAFTARHQRHAAWARLMF